jgi:trimeric autotransporter adhesin
MLLLASTAGVWAQTNQSPTQTVPVGNEPYLVTSTPRSTYSWSITPGNSGTTWEINGTGNSITVDWNIPGVYTLSVVETNSEGCHGLPVSVTVTVYQNPNVNDPPDQTVCNGSRTTAVNFTGAVAGTVYNWTNNTPSIGLAATGSGNIASFTAVNTGTTPIVATITVTPSYTNAGTTYTGTPQSFTITVNPLPVTSPIYHN